jgi:hypothetical protein
MDEATDQPFYRDALDLPDGQSATRRLTLGMPAEAILITEDRTLVDYLMQPMADYFNRALRERYAVWRSTGPVAATRAGPAPQTHRRRTSAPKPRVDRIKTPSIRITLGPFCATASLSHFSDRGRDGRRELTEPVRIGAEIRERIKPAEVFDKAWRDKRTGAEQAGFVGLAVDLHFERRVGEADRGHREHIRKTRREVDINRADRQIPWIQRQHDHAICRSVEAQRNETEAELNKSAKSSIQAMWPIGVSAGASAPSPKLAACPIPVDKASAMAAEKMRVMQKTLIGGFRTGVQKNLVKLSAELCLASASRTNEKEACAIRPACLQRGSGLGSSCGPAQASALGWASAR